MKRSAGFYDFTIDVWASYHVRFRARYPVGVIVHSVSGIPDSNEILDKMRNQMK